jgi:hypothetical protein
MKEYTIVIRTNNNNSMMDDNMRLSSILSTATDLWRRCTRNRAPYPTEFREDNGEFEIVSVRELEPTRVRAELSAMSSEALAGAYTILRKSLHDMREAKLSTPGACSVIDQLRAQISDVEEEMKARGLALPLFTV